MGNEDASTASRAVTSYPARRGYKPEPLDPLLDHVVGVEGAIDIHCHAKEGQPNALSLAKLASKSGMRGLLFKSIHGPDRTLSAFQVQKDLDIWAEKEGVTPVTCWSGRHVAQGYTKPISVDFVRKVLDMGVRGLWMPNVNSAHTLHMVGGKRINWDKTAPRSEHTEPLPWEEAMKAGQYLLDEKGRLKPNIEEIFHIAADRGVAIFFGHPSKPEFNAMAEMCIKLNFKRGVVDHPFSPFVNLSIEEMKQAGSIGLWINFTYDELSPFLGIDPAVMYKAIRTTGPEHCTLSSDAGDPVFPNSVESLRLLLAAMKAFGCTPEEMKMMTSTNPAFVVGLDLSKDQCSAVRAAE
jgi:uncharacterized protein DUF6282